MDVDLIFKIAGLGILISILNKVLIQSGREEQAQMITLVGLMFFIAYPTDNKNPAIPPMWIPFSFVVGFATNDRINVFNPSIIRILESGVISDSPFKPFSISVYLFNITYLVNKPPDTNCIGGPILGIKKIN